VADDHLLTAAGRIADGDVIDWGSITSTLNSAHDREIAEELALVQQIAAGHRQLHQLLPAVADTPPHLMPDRARWGHLDLLNVVGRGSYGIVYRAWDTRLDRLVALKLFHGACDPDQVMQEGRMLARVRHENVVTIYGADMIDGVAGIWMELVHGKTLDDIVKGSGPLPAREAAAVGADVARALGAIHSAGLLHCDVKAHNVVWETGGRVVLMDLGAGRLAPEAGDGDHIREVAGTPRYMAPELFISGASATRASDIYSLGILMYFLVSGKYPTEGNTLGELRRAHDRGTMRPLASQRSGLPNALIEVVTRAIDRDPTLRPQAAAEMQSALAAIATPPQSIAVMPIQNLTGDPGKQYLADGFTEVLTAHLARLPGLAVASSATMATQRGAVADERALAEKLGVRLLLAGSVVQANNRIALSIRLIDPREGRTIWGSELERQPSTILDARSEIARLVAARLSLTVPAGLRADASRQLSAEAQDAFLRGLAAASNGSAANALAAIGLFSRAVQLEPTWADPLAHLALAEQRAIEFGNPADRRSRAQDVKARAMRAIEIDPSVPMSYTALAAVQAYHDWDFVAAESTLRQAIDTSPADASAQGRLALLLAAAGRLDEAVAAAQAARDREPLVPERHTNLGIVRYYARDFDAALADMDRALAIVPTNALGHHGRGRVLAALGRYDEAIKSLRQALTLGDNAGWWATLGVTYAQAGRLKELKPVLQKLREFEQRGIFVSVDQYAYIAAHEGRLDEAFRLLDEAVERRMTNVLWLAVDPRADALREDPRFARLIARMGLVAR
jgi:serine/threonine protein kinase/tetratricopeptide (TPR) repeat protein